MKIHNGSKIFNETKLEYFKLLEEIKQNKYFFPVIMGICTLNEVKTLNYEELNEVYKISNLKLEKQIFEMTLSKGML
ncbi:MULTISPECIES: DUF1322 family protein [Borrelia]|uniref:Uncharacterized protein n=4 Tax=Borrelia TaxID=138 RepID=A0AAN1CFK5_BORHE|nr:MULTISPECIES: DUF1322 family protein [Borrelia]AHH03893.1 Hypothetical protein BHY_0942 [Borrelia nietonii YOR]AHH13231.1 Hypothetical protein BHO_0009100 [Borrelia hermsii YBT]AHH14421.1 Hypothetical protein BHW_0009100 [Borrelia hermsii MTW]AMR76197.1 hypothetical protein A0V01_06320 [Borrelia hermsii]UPA08226.1 DUF1322 family protein [Borrelia hermsii DAH]